MNTTNELLKAILAEMSQLDFMNRLRVLGYVLSLHVRRQRHRALNVCLSVVVIVLALLLVAQAVRP